MSVAIGLAPSTEATLVASIGLSVSSADVGYTSIDTLAPAVLITIVVSTCCKLSNMCIRGRVWSEATIVVVGVAASSTAGTHVSTEVGTCPPGGLKVETDDTGSSSPAGTSGSVVNTTLTPTSVL